jgi:hypothetical protein
MQRPLQTTTTEELRAMNHKNVPVKDIKIYGKPTFFEQVTIIGPNADLIYDATGKQIKLTNFRP